MAALYHWPFGVVGRECGSALGSAATRARVVLSTRCQCAAYVLICAMALQSSVVRWWVVNVWLLPLLVGQPALWGHFIPQHTATDHDEDARHTARVVLTHPAYEWLTWNMNYHAVHHMNPRSPFHKLPAAFAAAPPGGSHRRAADFHAHATVSGRGRAAVAQVLHVSVLAESYYRKLASGLYGTT